PRSRRHRRTGDVVALAGIGRPGMATLRDVPGPHSPVIVTTKSEISLAAAFPVTYGENLSERRGEMTTLRSESMAVARPDVLDLRDGQVERQRRDGPTAPPVRVSVVVPTLNE